MTLKNNRAPLLWCFQLCAWFHCHMWIQTGVRVRKRLSWVLTSVTLTFDLWPWRFAWTSLLTMVLTPENFMMIRWWEHGEKGVTDRQTDRQTDRRTDGRTENTICRAAWSQLKIASTLAIKLANIGKSWCVDVVLQTLVLCNEFENYTVLKLKLIPHLPLGQWVKNKIYQNRSSQITQGLLHVWLMTVTWEVGLDWICLTTTHVLQHILAVINWLIVLRSNRDLNQVVLRSNRDLNQGLLHLWSKFGDPSLNGWWVIMQKKLCDGQTDRQTDGQTYAGTTIPGGKNWPWVKICCAWIPLQ